MAVIALLGAALSVRVASAQDAPVREPDAAINLATEEGVRLVQGRWRCSEALEILVLWRDARRRKVSNCISILSILLIPSKNAGEKNASRRQTV
jgi:hypothetical protein